MSSRTANAPTEPVAFIAWENDRKGRYELVAGEVRAMAGGTRAHDLVAGNILAALRTALRGADCDVHGSNLKVVSPTGVVTYPDVFVRCGPLADEATECDDPVLVVELASARGRPAHSPHRWAYQAIPTLRHLVYAASTRTAVEVATRVSEGAWTSVFLSTLADLIQLDGLGMELPLAEVYAGTSVG